MVPQFFKCFLAEVQLCKNDNKNFCDFPQLFPATESCWNFTWMLKLINGKNLKGQSFKKEKWAVLMQIAGAFYQFHFQGQNASLFSNQQLHKTGASMHKFFSFLSRAESRLRKPSRQVEIDLVIPEHILFTGKVPPVTHPWHSDSPLWFHLSFNITDFLTYPEYCRKLYAGQ